MSIKKLSVILNMMVVCGIAYAKVPPEQMARLDQDLTPLGSERGANRDGSIPEWKGGLTAPPEGIGYEKGKHLPAPFASDEPLFRVTGGNADDYDQFITRGQRALLERHDSYFLDVYPTRRSCAHPEFVYKAARNNALVGELVSDGNGVAKAIMASPFPIPNNGLEIVWNHTLRYRGYKLQRQFTAIPVNQSGDYYQITVHDDAILRWSDPQKRNAEELDNISIYYLLQTKAPARSAGYVVLVQESLNMSVEARRAWTYSPGTRRVRRAPTIAYDNPGTNSDGITTSDSFGGFNGAPDRFDWTMRGRSEKFIAYNNYRRVLAPYEELVGKKHVNQELMRYEKHRVWEVEGNLKESFRHVYSRRVFYIDEDTKGIVATEIYDGRGQLWRVQELGGGVQYELPLCGGSGDTVYDLMVGRYLMLGLINEEKPIDFDAQHLDASRYTPSNIRRLGR
ncbi:MAG: outer membrane lipoprotein-sorting protein [Rhodobiaceae bacterium]|nr:outer membrane lipoprotein-sorting protein [Rhodobiaceae bacterium]